MFSPQLLLLEKTLMSHIRVSEFNTWYDTWLMQVMGGSCNGSSDWLLPPIWVRWTDFLSSGFSPGPTLAIVVTWGVN